MRLIAAVPFLFTLAFAVAADPALTPVKQRPTFAAPRTLVPCQIVKVHDADSFIATVPFMFADGVSRTDMVRVQGADAWEVDQSRAGTVGRISQAEIIKGIAARDAVIALTQTADQIYLEPRRKGDVAEPHGRISAHVWLWFKQDGRLIELADWLKDNGHTRGSNAPSK